MNAIRITAIVLIVAGTLGLMYGGFTYTYTTETHAAKLGPIELRVRKGTHQRSDLGWRGRNLDRRRVASLRRQEE